jgi:hypothetical protein
MEIAETIASITSTTINSTNVNPFFLSLFIPFSSGNLDLRAALPGRAQK